MTYWGNGMSGWGIALMTVSNLLFWGLVITGAVALVRHFGEGGPAASRPVRHRETPEQVLADRFACGKIDEDEYARRLRVLRGVSVDTDAG